jgi:hypothetical protein
VVHGDALPLDQIQEVSILPLAQSVHRLGAREILWTAIRQADVPRSQEIADSRTARLAIEVGAIVDRDVEGHERRGARGQVLVEQLLPLGSVQRSHRHHPTPAHPSGSHEHHRPTDPHADGGAHAAHDRHAGHSVEMFRRKFWGTLLLSIPTVVWAPMVQHWLGYEAWGGPALW